MTRYDADIVVVGAGPAGSAAAIVAARDGADVLLVDRAAFPRDKPCGDLIGARALRQARALGIDEEVIRRYASLSGVLVTTGQDDLPLEPGSRVGKAIVSRSDARVIPRRIFDTAMVAAAMRAGARLETAAIRSVEAWDGDGRVVRGVRSGEQIAWRARAVIVAGGYGCRLATTDDPPRPAIGERPHGIAMRGYVEGIDAPSNQIVFCLDEWLLPGYGWLFPLPGGRANVGVGTLVTNGQGEKEHLRDIYRRFIEDPASPVAAALRDATETEPPRSWPLDLGPRPSAVADDGLLVAGEAAALVGPMTGAGIAFALESGARAGATAVTAMASGDTSLGSLQPYAGWLRRHPYRWLQVEAHAHAVVSDPARLNRLVRLTRPLPPTGLVGAWTLLNLG